MKRYCISKRALSRFLRAYLNVRNLTLIIRQPVIPDFRHRHCTCRLIVFKIIHLSGAIRLAIRDINIINITGSATTSQSQTVVISHYLVLFCIIRCQHRYIISTSDTCQNRSTGCQNGK